MENNGGINSEEIGKIIKAINSAKKPSLVLLRIGILFMAVLAMLAAINIHSNSVVSSFLNFSFYFLTTSLCLILFNYYLSKVSIVGSLYVLNNLIDQISKNEWSYHFPTRNIHPLILLHPVFRLIAGLYIFRVGNEDDGLSIIDKAASEMPEIKDSVSQGKIFSMAKFRALSDIAMSDLSPGSTFVAVFRLILALNSLLILVLVIVLISAFLYEFLASP